MSAKAARRLLVFALVLSLLVHALAVFFLPKHAPTDTSVVRVTLKHVAQTSIVRVQPTPKPSLVPRKPPAHHPPVHGISVPIISHALVARIRSQVVHVPVVRNLTTVRSSGATGEVKGIVGTPTVCNAPAAIAALPSPPDIAPEVRSQMSSGIARVLVHLDATGTIQDASILASTGNPALDQIAMTMARSATYVPAHQGCKAIASDYTFSARFAPW